MNRALLVPWCALVLGASCGEVVGPAATDSPGAVDAPVDTPDADLTGMATVVTQSALYGQAPGARAPNIEIVSMYPNNTVLATATTDVNGAATIAVYPGGTVTAVYRHTLDMGADLITWADVQPGDTLTFGNAQPNTNSVPFAELGPVTYTWPAQPAATNFQVITSCSSSSTSGTSVIVREYTYCHQEPMDVLFIARNANGQVTHHSFRSNVPFTAGGSVSANGWSATQTGTINITGLPSEISNVSGQFGTVLDGYRAFASTSYSGTLTGGAYSQTFNWHPTGERTVGEVYFSRDGFNSVRLLDAMSTSTLTQTVAAPTIPPWVQGGVVTSSALRMAMWFVVPNEASTADGQLARTEWSVCDAQMCHYSYWHFILPPDVRAIRFPNLPAQFNDVLPKPEIYSYSQHRVFDIAAVSGYDMLRSLPSSVPMCLECAIRTGEIQRVVFSSQ